MSAQAEKNDKENSQPSLVTHKEGAELVPDQLQIQRLPKDVKFHEVINRGSFGIVTKGTFQEQLYAIKSIDKKIAERP